MKKQSAGIYVSHNKREFDEYQHTAKILEKKDEDIDNFKKRIDNLESMLNDLIVKLKT